MNKINLKRIRNISELEKLLPLDDSDEDFYLYSEGALERVFIKRLCGFYKDGDYHCNERYFINHNPVFEESDFSKAIAKSSLVDKADSEFHEYKDYEDVKHELKSGEFELYMLTDKRKA